MVIPQTLWYKSPSKQQFQQFKTNNTQVCGQVWSHILAYGGQGGKGWRWR